MISIKTLTWLSKAPREVSFALPVASAKKSSFVLFFFSGYVYATTRSQTLKRTVFKRSSATQCGRKRACDP